ncbi:ribosome biogenesis protein-like protein Brx1 [Hortaea werneckii]|nr:ribosome biogenesis protein-like protein Brx1 [Hortaea werneckii]
MSAYKSFSKQKTSGQKRDDEEAASKPKNRQRVLMLTSRGVTYRHRHLLGDLNSLLPHSRKDAKLDTKTKLQQLNELADLYNCNNVMFFEARKGKDLYLWLSKPPNGPTIKFHANNLHTMEELNFTGNCLKGSRPVLSFDAGFEKQAHTRVIKEVLTQQFGVPQTSRKVKPFVDHVMGFTLADNKVWIRCYQIAETETAKAAPSDPDTADSAPTATVAKNGKGETNISLIEIGPRFVLTPIIILEGSFGGPVIYENKEFVSPNQIRSDLRRAKAGRHNRRAESMVERKAKRRDMGLNTGEGPREIDELDDQVLFA